MMSKAKFRGSLTALVTPFRDGAIDEKGFRDLIDWQIAEGTSGLVPVGTTGESPTLGFEEHYQVIDACLEAAAGRVPVIAGCGSNDTATAIRHMRYARQAGAAAALVVAPYYNKPSQDGMIAHYRALADACELPIVVYNVPGRTVADISADTMCKLAEIPTVVAIKDASGDLARVTEHRAGAGADFSRLNIRCSPGSTGTSGGSARRPCAPRGSRACCVRDGSLEEARTSARRSADIGS